MRRLAFGAVALLLMGTAVSAAPDPQLIAPIQKFIDSFNKGDAAGAAATHSATEDLAIIDEVAPYLWRGAQAFQIWSADLESDSKKNGITDQLVTMGAPTRIETTGELAYVVVPSVYTFKEHGVAKREAAQMTVVLRKDAGVWLIHGWTWTGQKPKRVAPVPAPAKP